MVFPVKSKQSLNNVYICKCDQPLYVVSRLSFLYARSHFVGMYDQRLFEIFKATWVINDDVQDL